MEYYTCEVKHWIIFFGYMINSINAWPREVFLLFSVFFNLFKHLKFSFEKCLSFLIRVIVKEVYALTPLFLSMFAVGI